MKEVSKVSDETIFSFTDAGKDFKQMDVTPLPCF